MKFNKFIKIVIKIFNKNSNSCLIYNFNTVKGLTIYVILPKIYRFNQICWTDTSSKIVRADALCGYFLK